MARRFIRVLAGSLVLSATFPLDVLAQTSPATVAQPPVTAQPFSAEQLDALVASIALYPDELLTQLLMASTFPLEVVAAARWVEDPARKSLSGDALTKALEAEPWGGIMTFMVGPDGDVYQKDLGPKTASIAGAMTAFDPDLSWSRVDVTNE